MGGWARRRTDGAKRRRIEVEKKKRKEKLEIDIQVMHDIARSLIHFQQLSVKVVAVNNSVLLALIYLYYTSHINRQPSH
jgi:hypothetical protein